MARRQGSYPKLSSSGDRSAGQRLYSRNCASCHGVRGEGNGPGAAGLHPRPANLSEHEYALDRLGIVALERRCGNGNAGVARSSAAGSVRRCPSGARISRRRSRSPRCLRMFSISGANVYAAHCAQCHGENGAGDGSAAGQFPIAPTELPDAAPDPGRQPARSEEWSGRHAHGALDRRTFGSRIVRGRLFCARILPEMTMVHAAHGVFGYNDGFDRASGRCVCRRVPRRVACLRRVSASGLSGPSTAFSPMCKAMMRYKGARGKAPDESGMGADYVLGLCAAIGVITVVATIAWGTVASRAAFGRRQRPPRNTENGSSPRPRNSSVRMSRTQKCGTRRSRLACASCHIRAGLEPGNLSLVAALSRYVHRAAERNHPGPDQRMHGAQHERPPSGRIVRK